MRHTWVLALLAPLLALGADVAGPSLEGDPALRVGRSVSLVVGLNGGAQQLTTPAANSIIEGISPTFARLNGSWVLLERRWFDLGASLELVGHLRRLTSQSADYPGSAFVAGGSVFPSVSARLFPVEWLRLSAQAGLLAEGTGVPLPVVGEAASRVQFVSLVGPAAQLSLAVQLGPVTAGAWVGGRAAPAATLVRQSARSTGWELGVRATLRPFTLGPLRVAPLALVSLGHTVGVSYDNQWSDSVLRVGIGVELQPPPDPSSATGPDVLTDSALLVGEVTTDDGAPASGASVTVGTSATTTTGADGRFGVRLGDAHGAVEVAATLPGFKRATQRVMLGLSVGPTECALRLERAKGPGRLRGTVLGPDKTTPVVGAQVLLGKALRAKTDAQGQFTFEAGPGPVTLTIKALSYTTLEDTVAVAPSVETAVSFVLSKPTERVMATLRGVIRSATGKPIRASVSIGGVKTKVKLSPDGRFVVTVPEGTYTLTISAPGHVTQVRTTEVAAGDQVLFHSDLQPLGK